MRDVLMSLGVALTAAAGITVIPVGVAQWVTAALAFTAAIVSGFTTGFSPSKRAEAAILESVQWEDLASDSEMFLTKLNDFSDQDAVDKYDELRRRRAALKRCLDSTSADGK